MKPFRLARSVINARDICHRVTHGIRTSIDPSIRVSLELSSETGDIHGDARLLDRALLSLILNACDAMPDGGDLLVSSSNIDRETGSGIEKFVRVVVADNGAGIAPGIREHIFDAGGGLAIVDRIVRDSGGEISVRSAVGLGSSFEILLPRVEDTEFRCAAAALRQAA